MKKRIPAVKASGWPRCWKRAVYLNAIRRVNRRED